MRILPAHLCTLALALALAGPGQAADIEAPLTPEAARAAQCAIAAVVIRLKVAASAGMKLAYGPDVPSDKGVTEGSWTPRMAVPFLREFDAHRQVSAIPLCPGLRAELDALGARVVEGLALDDTQWGLSRAERTAVLRVTLPLLSADGTRALVRAEAPCGWGCGSADTYQFTRDGADWKQTAIRVEWTGTLDFDASGRQIPPGR
jgi:hypothetical protein